MTEFVKYSVTPVFKCLIVFISFKTSQLISLRISLGYDQLSLYTLTVHTGSWMSIIHYTTTSVQLKSGKYLFNDNSTNCFTGEYIEECVGLADEYMLGRLKHACSDYMISNATSLQLNDCLFYLFLAHKYRLSDVEEKIISLNRQRSTADILRCSNYDVTAVGPLILKHTQWLEEEMTSLKSGINRFKKWVSKSISDIINSLQTAMTDPVQPVRCKEGHTITGQGHNDIPFSKISKTFVNNCHGCALLIISQLKSELDYINNYRPFSRGLTKKSFLDQLDIKFAELSGLWYVSIYPRIHFTIVFEIKIPIL